MKRTETIDLVKGTFTPKEAQEILLQLLISKTNFHNLKNWSSRERFGKPDVNSEQRLKYLEEYRQKVQTLISKASNEQKNIVINKFCKFIW